MASRDGVRLFTRSVRPPQPLGVVGIVHGYGDHSGCYLESLERLAAAGFEAQAFDLRGHGRSSGRRGAVVRWDDYLADLDAFLARLRQAAGGASLAGARPLFLLGQSHGALLLIHAALRGLNEIRGLVLTSPYLRIALAVPRWKLAAGRAVEWVWPWCPIPSEVRDEMLTGDPAMLESCRTDPLRLRFATPRWYFAARKAQIEALACSPQLHLPILIVQGDRDPVADPAASELFFQRLGSEDKTYRHFHHMRHETLREAGREAVWTEILDWLRKRIDA